MTTIGILTHPGKPKTTDVAAKVAAWLTAQQVTVWIGINEDDIAQDKHWAATDVVLVLGGDGATLRAARLASGWQVPVFCINMGRIGFLSEAELDSWQQKLSQYLQGDFWLERRLMLQAKVFHNETIIHEMQALNDVVIGRGTQARVVRLTLFVDEAQVTTYTADSLIVATPTGSTAYSMAAGGPILPPELQNFLVVPVAPHLSLNRALVLHRQAVITVQVEMTHNASVTADGQAFLALASGDKVVIQAHPQEACFVRIDRQGYFYQRLLRRLGVHERHNR